MADVLRYPYEAITDKTDYLQVNIIAYPGTGALVEDGGFGVNQSSFDIQAKLLGSQLKAKQLAPGGTIILPMPSNIEDSNSVSYDGDSLNSITAGAIEGASSLMTGVSLADPSTWGTALKGAYNQAVTTAGLDVGKAKNLLLKQLAAQAVNVFGTNVSINQILARSEGKIFNPNMELLFNNTTLRTFRFSFKMTPRDEFESRQIKSIIRSFKRNMAPSRGGGTSTEQLVGATIVDGAVVPGTGTKVAGVTNNSLYLNTPNVFELAYRKGNKRHPFLHAFKMCALSDMSVNYTGENVYASYNDGTPISVILNLTFKEIVPIYQEDYAEVTEQDLIYNTDGSTYGVGY